MNFKFKKDDRVVSRYGCGTIVSFKWDRIWELNMYQIFMDGTKVPKPLTIHGRTIHYRIPTHGVSENGLTLLSEWLESHKKYGLTYNEIMKNMRAKWEREHELNRLRRLGYVTDVGEYI